MTDIPGQLPLSRPTTTGASLDLSAIASGNVSTQQRDLISSRLTAMQNLDLSASDAQPARVLFSGDIANADVKAFIEQLGVILPGGDKKLSAERFLLLMVAGKIVPATTPEAISTGDMIRIGINKQGQIMLMVNDAEIPNPAVSQSQSPSLDGQLSPPMLKALVSALASNSSQQTSLAGGLSALQQILQSTQAALPDNALQSIRNLLNDIMREFPINDAASKPGLQSPPTMGSAGQGRLFPLIVSSILPEMHSPQSPPGGFANNDAPAKLMETLMRNSGLFHENKLVQLASAAGSSKGNADMISTNINQLISGFLGAGAGENAGASQASTSDSRLTANINTIQALIRAANQQGKPSTTAGVSNSSDDIGHNLKAILQRHLLTLMQGLPATAQASEQELTGLLENRLLQAPFDFPVTNTTSSVLHSLVADGEELSVGKLLRLISGMLHRIQFDQLNSLYHTHARSSEGTPVQHWFMEIPMATPQGQIHVAQLRIDREKDEEKHAASSGKEKAIQWNIVLSFDFEQTGPMTVQTRLAPPNVSTTLWAEKPETLKLLNQETKALRHHLSELGLEVGDIQCLKGQPKLPKARLDQQLVDTQA